MKVWVRYSNFYTVYFLLRFLSKIICTFPVNKKIWRNHQINHFSSQKNEANFHINDKIKVSNQTLLSLHGVSLEITPTVPLRFLNFYFFVKNSTFFPETSKVENLSKFFIFINWFNLKLSPTFIVVNSWIYLGILSVSDSDTPVSPCGPPSPFRRRTSDSDIFLQISGHVAI